MVGLLLQSPGVACMACYDEGMNYLNPDGLLMTHDWSVMERAFEAECDALGLKGLDRLKHKMPLMLSEDIKPSEFALKAASAMGRAFDKVIDAGGG